MHLDEISGFSPKMLDLSSWWHFAQKSFLFSGNSSIDLQISMHVDWDSSNTEGQLDFLILDVPTNFIGHKS